MASLMRNAYTAVIARGEWWEGTLQTEPYEAAWAAEALFFVRVMQTGGDAHVGAASAVARVQISPDGMHWIDEGGSMRIAALADALAFVRVREFGGWLRLAVEVPAGSRLQVVATLALKA
jgi:predicted lipoprotein